MFSQWFERMTDAIENERKLKKWSRAKKDAPYPRQYDVFA